MAKVFVTQYFERGDFSAAEQWGEVVFMTKLEHKPQPTHADANDPVKFAIERSLADYIPGIDSILVAPSQVINLLVGSCLESGKQHRILKWDNRCTAYRLHLLDL